MNSAIPLYVADVFVGPDGRIVVELLVPAWHEGKNQWGLWCSLCGGVHYHGRVVNDELHRAAHCGSGNYRLFPMPGARPPRRPAVLAEIARLTQQSRRRTRTGKSLLSRRVP